MQKRLILALIVGAVMAPLSSSAQIFNNWAGGSIRAGVTTGTSSSTSTETVNSVQQVYGGSTYTVTGSNIIANGPPGPGQTYTVVNNDGSPFQFSETFQPAGIVSTTITGRTINGNTLTNSLSVFSEVGTN
jgi:hypothetical protein